MQTISFRSFYFCFFIIYCYSTSSFGQRTLVDSQFENLEDWKGETFTTGKDAQGWFEINTDHQLQLNVTGGSGQRSSTALFETSFQFENTSDTLVWSMSFMHNFSVSSSLQKKNYSKFILFQNHSTSDTSVYLELSSGIKLIHQIDDELVVVEEKAISIVPSTWHQIKVQKVKGLWTVYLDDVFIYEVFYDDISLATYHTGLLATFSSSARGQHFYYDDFIHLIRLKAEDITPPKVSNVFLEGIDTLIVEFDEIVNHDSCKGSLTINAATVDYLSQQSSLVIHNHFEIDSLYTLQMTDFCDEAGNILNDTTISLLVEDTYPPHIDSLSVKSDYILDLFFDEPVVLTEFSNIFLISKSDTIEVVDTLKNINEKQKSFVLGSSIPTNKSFEVHIKELTDEKGNFQDVTFTSYFDTRPPKLLSSEILNGDQINIEFDEPVSEYINDPYNYIINDQVVPESIMISGHRLDLLFQSNTFKQDSVYTITITAVEDLFGNEMNTKILTLEFDTTKAEILNTFQSTLHNQILFDEKIVSIDSSSHQFQNIDCPSSIIILEKVSSVKLFGVKDENQNVIDSVEVFFNDDIFIEDFYCASDSSIRVISPQYISDFELENSRIDSIKSLNEVNDLYVVPKFQDGENRVLKFQGKEYIISYIKNEIQSVITSSTHSITIDFEKELNEQHIPLISTNPHINIQNILIEGDKLHLFLKDPIPENRVYNFSVEGLVSCENQKLPHSSFQYTKDTSSPLLVDVSWKDRNQLLLLFNEKVEKYSIENRITLYQGEKEIHDFSLKVNEEYVELILEKEYWEEEIHYTIHKGVEDWNGNKTSLSVNGNVIPVNSVKKGDLILTEIFADPTPIIGLPNSEALELYNTSTDTLSLLGVDLLIGSDTLTFDNEFIAPETYLVLVPSTKLEMWSEYPFVSGVNHWSALNNSGEIIKLLNAKNELLIDSVKFDLSTYKDKMKSEGGYSLERRDFFFDCDPFLNWAASEDEAGGTLGFENSIFEIIQDTISSKITNITVVDEHNMVISFDKSLYMFSTESTIQYSVDNVSKYVDKWCFVDNFNLKVLVNEDLPKGVLVTMIVDNFQDCFNNTLFSEKIDFVIKPKINYQQLLITELMIDHSPINKMPDSEYIEVYNNSDLWLNLDKCIMLIDGDSVELSDNWILPRNYAVLVPNANRHLFDTLTVEVIGVSNWETLLNDQGKVVLVNDENEIIHSVSYSLDYYHDQNKKDGGWSIEMRDVKSPCVGLENWQASEDENGGTAGYKNSIEETVIDRHVPTLESALFLEKESNVLLQFSEPIAITEQTELIIDGEYISKENVTLNGNHLLIYLSYDLSYSYVSISAIVDCSGNFNSTVMEKEILYPMPKEQVFLSEILFDPSTLNTDYLEVFFQVEKGSYVNLKDWSIGRERNGAVEQVVALSKMDDYLFSNQFLVFTKEEDKLLSFYPHLKRENMRVVNLPSFPNENGNVVLLQNGEVYEKYEYSEKHHQSFLKNTEDVSLERIDFTVSSSNPNNWTSATESSGFGTPTFINSRVVRNELDEYQDNVLVFSTSLLTTNGDGRDDYLKVENNSIFPLRILRMDIYDIHGNIIYPWLNNYELSSRDFVKWDGVDQDGKRVMGKFLVYYQLVDHKGNRQEQTKIVSVAPWN
ncbi:hypothetical protein [Flammeovirga sp. EKP202]|uniref:hypothetical protein n=1 Tax=Flammeovirga sp. EKP202 TaxID=2770592 RepID=UPI00165FE1C6|nr:hypothetical protein [Flammeovirga sp. EKP202]MBD0399759.1 hypothetical protein [Flammeovirga sp. EKP202]